ncbi:hypothetical protein WJ47_26675 [Burkholderia ubonensis]|uniref:Uncharacterized protein n=1 Tax=Burkholderia ubonensis TaxID=101571 RepID=A0AB73G347_9BURK|nr:hypothetical protein WI75_30650 [Burkholderia ubonensis]KVG70718.1 hypothetical protein WJ34_24820 [Burkholderia ubonensis]KVH19434.1 hypothetical protein WJ37_19840 [Burkholderia ubonensis]KVH44927.1 hypothetical protein WJ38_25530 [Burkholderia ubonensis]KVH83676.1 hypothetical protein WJ43_19140 [Burkholderia ubonensis]
MRRHRGQRLPRALESLREAAQFARRGPVVGPPARERRRDARIDQRKACTLQRPSSASAGQRPSDG